LALGDKHHPEGSLESVLLFTQDGIAEARAGGFALIPENVTRIGEQIVSLPALPETIEDAALVILLG
jgi:hypothetical protein